MMQQSLIIIDIGLSLAALYLTIEFVKEKELRATSIALLGVMFHIAVLYIILSYPSLSFLVSAWYGFLGLGLLVFLIPRSPNKRALKGIRGYAVYEAPRPDERDTVSSRSRLQPSTEAYLEYYSRYPELEEGDRKRRMADRIGGVIDGGYRPNVAMSRASFKIPYFLTPIAYAEPVEDQPPYKISPEKATMIVKNLAKHLGAKLVGVCHVNPLCIYTNARATRSGRWVVDGEEVDYPPYAVVIATEMNAEHVNSAPHTPTIAETGNQYANGAYISTVIAHWFSHMGFTGIAEHTGHYDAVLPPLAFQAGLGEIGRHGYLITPTAGSRVRLSAILTDMLLVPDKPIDLGVEEFCSYCKKCANTCPSKSIPDREKTVYKGVEKWKVVAETCRDYWNIVGTDCAICMAICPFSRPHTSLHNVVRWFIKHSRLAPKMFTIIDDFLYGKRWRPKSVSLWLKYNQGEIEKEVQ